jgi:hypothetical protein
MSGLRLTGGKVDVRQFLVEWSPLFGEPAEPLAAVAGLDQRPAAVPLRALELLGHGRAQVHDQAAAAQKLPVSPAEHDAAAGRQQHAAPSGQFLQHAGFPVAKSRFAFDVENQGDAGAGPASNS